MKKTNTAASIRQRLLNFAKEHNENFDYVLTQYAMQRLLYRLSISEFKNRFLLKGALLFSIWDNNLHRPTRFLLPTNMTIQLCANHHVRQFL